MKMSRARECSTVYVVADSLDQAVEDLERSWSQSRRIGWAIDRGTAAPGAGVAAPSRLQGRDMDASLRHARLVAEREAVAAVVPVDPGFEYPKLQNRVQRMEAELEELEKADGSSTWQGTPVGEAAIAWQDALREWRWCWTRSEHVGWRERHRLIRRADRAEEREGPLRDAYERLAAPERTRLRAELAEAKELLADLDGRFYGNLHFQIRHPEALRRLERLDSQIAAVSRELDVERQGLDGIAPLPLPSPKRDWEIERDGPFLERGIDLGIGR